MRRSFVKGARWHIGGWSYLVAVQCLVPGLSVLLEAVRSHCIDLNGIQLAYLQDHIEDFRPEGGERSRGRSHLVAVQCHVPGLTVLHEVIRGHCVVA